ncbi:MAG: MBL fold metallo-hydrolase [Clostridia bacterium]|nr:MBL fold metallo-hydrolase [Clostridia bacterium]
MKVTKYNQSCLLIEANQKRILVDPGNIGYDESLLKEWSNIDYILVTHRHGDHCNAEAINNIINRDGAKLYTTKEVADNVKLINPNIVKANDIIQLDDIKVEVTKAIHGFFTKMKYSKGEIFENVGYIIDDGKNRLYTTSDTINFNNDYKCDILCMPFNGNGLTLGIIDGVMFAKDINPKLVLPIHTEHPLGFMNPNIEDLKKELEKADIEYKILNVKESLEIED